MSLENKLFDTEQGFWLFGRTHFLKHVDAECMLAFPQSGEMHGILSRGRVASTATYSNRWRDLGLTNGHLLQPASDFAIISYRANVTRPDDQPYSALVSSAYVKREGGWKLAFHQHSPVEG